MAQQIKKKFLSPEVINYFDNQIDSVEQSVLSEQSRAEGQEAAIRSEFAAADLVLDGKIEQEKLDRASGDSSTLQSAKDYSDAKVLEEKGLREAGDSALDGRITTLEAQVGQNLQQAISDLQAADAGLQSQINTEKGRIDAILLASDADKDSFAEIVALINSVDTENDTAFGNYVLSNNAALAQEVSDRQSGDSSTLQSAKDYTDAQIAAIPAVDLSNYYTKSEVDAKESALASDISDLDVYAQDIRSDVDSLEVYAQDIRSDVDAHETELASHDSRLDALEAKVDGPAFSNGSVVVGAELAYIDLDREYIKLMSCAVGRMAIHEGEDFTVSVVGGKTRLTWIGSLLNPSGEEKIETGDKVFFVGAY